VNRAFAWRLPNLAVFAAAFFARYQSNVENRVRRRGEGGAAARRQGLREVRIPLGG